MKVKEFILFSLILLLWIVIPTLLAFVGYFFVIYSYKYLFSLIFPSLCHYAIFIFILLISFGIAIKEV